MVSGLGRLSDDIFYDLFNDYLDNPIFICTDANKVYSKYSGMFNIPHYIKPSNYNDVLKKNEYYNTEDIEKKEIINLKLYNNKMIDYIENRGKITYTEFKKLKEMNKLSLSRVNQLHNEIKKFINIDKTNVSTKFLNDYIKFFNYIRNWKVKNGHYPSSQKDIKSIFEEILTKKVNYTINDIKNKQLEIPKPTGRFTKILKEETKKIRKIASNNFKFNEENISLINKREYLLSIPVKYLYNLCKEYKIPKYRKLAKWSLVTLLLKQKDIKKNIYELILKCRIF